MKWFKHDSDANTDAKLKKLRHKYGITGYGLYWYCIELIAGSVSPKNISFELEEDAEIISLEWKLDQLKVQEMMQYMAEINLFDITENNRIRCLKLAKRLDDTNAKNPQIRSIIEGMDSDLLRLSPTKSEEVRPDKIRLDETREDINFVFDQYNRIVRDLKPNWMKCSSVTDPRRKAIKRAMNQCSERAKELSVDESKYLVDLLGAMAEDAEFFSGHPNNTSKGFNCSFDTNFRQERISQAIDKFSGE